MSSGLKVKSRRVHFNAVVERPGTPRLFEGAKYFRSHAAFPLVEEEAYYLNSDNSAKSHLASGRTTGASVPFADQDLDGEGGGNGGTKGNRERVIRRRVFFPSLSNPFHPISCGSATRNLDPNCK